MNRLILIGNGFDLAHGMKTSYMDFIKWYLSICFLEAFHRDRYSDALLTLRRNENYDFDITAEKVSGWVEENSKGDFNLEGIGFNSKISTYQPFIVEHLSPLLKQLLVHCAGKRWVDIEAVFYERLIANFKLTGEDEDRELEKLNNAMSALYKKLEDYLISLPSPQPIQQYSGLIREPFSARDFESGRKYNNRAPESFSGKRPEKILIVNFNYTETLGLYPDIKGHSTVSLINIHGQLHGDGNPIVLGFGDELDMRYAELEQRNKNAYFKYMKSFEYLRNENYKELIRFIDGNLYQVYIIGHSCGLSDRTMLNMVFEHDKCSSIKIFYHKRNTDTNYTETSYEIARHFKDKATLRRRVVSFEASSAMPQR